MSDQALWERFKARLCVADSVGVSVDLSRMGFSDQFLAQHDPALRKALVAMDALEAGAIANPDEQRMVGHYWLRDPGKAPTGPQSMLPTPWADNSLSKSER